MVFRALAAALFLLLAACGGYGARPTPTASGPRQLTIMTHASFAVSEAVVKKFEAEHNVKLVFLPGGDAGEVLNKAILTREAPLADVLYGVDNTFLSRALQAGIFEPYDSPALADIPAGFRLDPSNSALPVDYGDVCINYDRAWFASRSLPVPDSLEDLAEPEYKGLLVMENPATSSPGLAFLLATIRHFGEDGYLDYWRQLRQNGVTVVDGWETAYYTNFSGSSGKGPQPLVVSYASSPAAEVVYAEKPLDEAPTASILAPDTCFRQVEFAGILKGTKQPELARLFVDYMLGLDFQEDMPLQMFVYPVNPKAVLPDVFVKYAAAALDPASLPPVEIASHRDDWIDAWSGAVLK